MCPCSLAKSHSLPSPLRLSSSFVCLEQHVFNSGTAPSIEVEVGNVRVTLIAYGLMNFAS
jgi:hypothetical protein